MSGRCVPPEYGSFSAKTSPGSGSVLEHGGDRLGHRAEVNRDVLGLRDHAAVGVEQGARAVAALLDVRRAAAADEHDAHLLGDADERADEDRQRHRVGGVRPAHRRSRTSAPVASSVAGPARADDAGRLREARRPPGPRTLSPGARSAMSKTWVSRHSPSKYARRCSRSGRRSAARRSGELRLRARRRCRRPGSRPARPARRRQLVAVAAPGARRGRTPASGRELGRPGPSARTTGPAKRASAKRRSVTGAGDRPRRGARARRTRPRARRRQALGSPKSGAT